MFYSFLSSGFTCSSSSGTWTSIALWYTFLSFVSIFALILLLSYFQWKWVARQFGFFKSRIGRFLIKGYVGWLLIIFGVQESLLPIIVIGGFIASGAIVHLLGMLPCIRMPKAEGDVELIAPRQSTSASA
jgi:hypothetical protein